MSGQAKVAVIGLGQMGGPIADHIIEAGHDVRVYDIAHTAVAARVAAGATAAPTAAAAARGAEFVDVIVFDDAQAIDVIAGPNGVLSTLDAGAIISVHTTVSVDTIRKLAELAATRGVDLIDAGISGGAVGSKAGTLLTMVGGPVDVVARASPILMTFSKEVVHAGPLGAGMALKLARNAAGYIMMAAVQEAMEIAHRAGVDLEQLRHAISVTGMFDQALAPFAFGGPEALPADAPEEQRAWLVHTLKLGEKDLDQALALAAYVGATVPVTEETRRNYHRVVRL